jgi:hypothetical protein
MWLHQASVASLLPSRLSSVIKPGLCLAHVAAGTNVCTPFGPKHHLTLQPLIFKTCKLYTRHCSIISTCNSCCGCTQAGKLFNKLTKMAAAKIKDEGKLGLREDSNDAGGGGMAMQFTLDKLSEL